MNPFALVALVFIVGGGLSLGYLFSPWCHFNGRGESAGFAGIALAFISAIVVLVGIIMLAVLGLISAFNG